MIVIVFSLGIVIGVCIGGVFYLVVKVIKMYMDDDLQESETRLFASNKRLIEINNQIIENNNIIEKNNKMLIADQELKMSKKKMMEIIEARNNYNSV